MGKLKWQLDLDAEDDAVQQAPPSKTVADLMMDKETILEIKRSAAKLHMQKTLQTELDNYCHSKELIGHKVTYEDIAFKVEEVLYANGWDEMQYGVLGFNNLGTPNVAFYIDEYLRYHWKPK